MSSDGIVGQILDGKYNIEKQLGKGGMGTVYLSTHIGTGRPVAVKVIAPEFMQRAEFVERFRREAKAAGRLRHPNVVDVTDFGFAKDESGKDVAYLVMEYLDGCTLGEVLDEEKKLPVSFTIDILEQVCSAVEEAHKQGIIHRDLKPDNIWLEPNQRGGYTVKVLDFGIAKLEEAQLVEIAESIEIPYAGSSNTNFLQNKQTIADDSQSKTISDKKSSTLVSENETMALVEKAKTLVSENPRSGTIIQPIEPKSSKEVSLEDGTAILPANQTKLLDEEDAKGTKIITDDNEDAKGTKVISNDIITDKPTLKSSTTNLTRVGAVLGTPLYMSPEQCRGEKLTAHSDIYSLAVITYQMLSGKLPFNGDYVKVMDGHKNEDPPELKVKKVPKKLKEIVMQSLSKNSEERPETAEAFASKLRSNSEGLGVLLRRAAVIYSERLPKFLQLTVLTFLPLIILNIIKAGFTLAVGFNFFEENITTGIIAVSFEVVHFFLSIITSAFLVGMMTWVVAQCLAFPLRPISLRPAFEEVKQRARSLSLTVGLSTIVSFIGYIFCFLPGIWLSAKFMLIAPSIMMEGISGKAAFKRSIELTKRSFRTVFATALLVYVIPLTVGLTIGIFIALANTAYVQSLRVTKMTQEMDRMKEEGVKAQPKKEEESKKDSSKPEKEQNQKDLQISLGKKGIDITTGGDSNTKSGNNNIKEDKEIKEKQKKFGSVIQAISQTVLIPFLVILASFTSVITALLYFKTRQAGGESMQELLGKLDDADRPQSKWQQRVRERLLQSGKITGSTTHSNKT